MAIPNLPIPAQSLSPSDAIPAQILSPSDAIPDKPCSLSPQPNILQLLPPGSKKKPDRTEAKKKKLTKNFKKKNIASSSNSLAPCSSKPKQLMLSQFLDALPKNSNDLSGGGNRS